MMIALLLLLGAFVSIGISDDSYTEKKYGEMHHIRLHRRPVLIEFSPKYNSNVTILWKKGDRPVIMDKKFTMIGSHFSIYKLTQEDSGRYIMRDKDLNELSTYTLEVKAIRKNFEGKPGDHFSFSYDLEPNSCNIYFFQESDRQPIKLKNEIVRQGRLQGGLDEFDCIGFDVKHPCGISNKALQMSCNGRYEIRDQNNNTALVASLEMNQIKMSFEREPGDLAESSHQPSRIGIGVGVFLSSLFCYCLKCYCCGKSSSKEDTPEIAAAEPDVQYQEYDHEPVGPGSDRLIQPPETLYPAQPSYTPTNPLVHNHPALNLPPAYSEVSAPVEQPDAPTFPLYSDPEPKFELKGMTFPCAPPLGSDSTHCDVYTSDKLNFL
ncbi:uncharacterized protein LOC129090140 [Anoplopoma fimbria]|uniref:uncharacterized protein LOC129090140 n=1 Tax=Anoplopoma fimbria TaxID=229290 RepID=UPI0023EBD051|nr:uncharacterized protein LOC129090140 [Anoplopoma fimbria]